MSTIFTDSVTISKPVDEVFDFATDPQACLSWLPGVTKIEPLQEGPLKPGYKWRETRRMGKRECAAVIECRTHKGPESGPPPYEHSAGATMMGLDCVYAYRFEPKGDGAARVSIEADATAKSLLGRLIRPMVSKMMKKTDGDVLHKLKHAMES